MPHILFVCTTNFVRSPLAEAIFNKLSADAGLASQLQAFSAGAFPGNQPRPAHRRAVQIAESHGLDIGAHRTRPIVAGELGRFQHIMAMDRDSYDYVQSVGSEIKAPHLRLFLEYSEQLSTRHVPDPVLDDASFTAVFSLIEDTCGKLFEALRGHYRL